MRVRRPTVKTKTNAFAQLLREHGWLLKKAPLPMLAAIGIDDEYIYVEKMDGLLHLHISSTNLTWEAKRYARETFGDYTTVYQAKGKGSGLESLKTFLESK